MLYRKDGNLAKTKLSTAKNYRKVHTVRKKIDFSPQRMQRAVKNYLASDAVGPVAERTLEDVHVVL